MVRVQSVYRTVSMMASFETCVDYTKKTINVNVSLKGKASWMALKMFLVWILHFGNSLSKWPAQHYIRVYFVDIWTRYSECYSHTKLWPWHWTFAGCNIVTLTLNLCWL